MTVAIKRANAPVEWIRLGELGVDRKLQRELKPGWVQTRVDVFDPLAFGVLTASLREDGTYVILDGQHRWELLKAQKWGMEQLVPCTVLRGLTFEQEASTFLKLNDRVRVSAFDQFKQRVNSGDPDARAIVATLKTLGLKIQQAGRSTGGVHAVQALERIYRGSRRSGNGQNSDVLAATLNVIIDAFGRESDAFQGEVIHGLGLVLLRDLKAIEIENLVHRLQRQYGKGGVRGLIGDAKVARQIHGGSLPHNLAGVVVNLYNKSRRANALESWWK